MDTEPIIGIVGHYLVSCPCGVEHTYDMEAYETRWTEDQPPTTAGLAEDARGFTCWCGRAYRLVATCSWVATEMNDN